MERMDKGMPFLLQYENVAWFEDGKVRILDRRVYPAELRYEVCTEYTQVAQAVKDMVTQSAGPYTAMGMGMALAAWQVWGRKEEEQLAFLEEASAVLSNARPTTANRYRAVTEACLASAREAFAGGEDPVEAIVQETIASLERRYGRMLKVGKNLLDLIPQGGCILTQCYGETIIGSLIKCARQEQKTFRVFCAETRPYFQGTRLTASCFASMGFDTTVLADNMAAYAMEREHIDLYTSAADSIAMSGHVANKVGTLQLAILAGHFGIPYYVTGMPDRDKKDMKDIVIEQRDPSLVLSCMGRRIALPEVKALYPAFDITPPELIRGLVTDRGVFDVSGLDAYFKDGQERFY